MALQWVWRRPRMFRETPDGSMMRSDADHHVVKRKLARFMPVIARELAEAHERRARHEAEQALKDRELQAKIELAAAYDATLDAWARALDLRDRETEGHGRRVAELTIRLAGMLGLPEADRVHVWRGALLHDIGKMAIPDAILLKPAELSQEDWTIMRLHPVYAWELLSPIEYLQPALDIPYCHHERWDGSGYPRGLRKEEIPLAARVFAPADIWDALRSNRPYRSAWPADRAREYIASLSGIHLDPIVTEAFLDLLSSSDASAGS
jgi:putative nucleotidyltransferase with HDIG domain